MLRSSDGKPRRIGKLESSGAGGREVLSDQYFTLRSLAGYSGISIRTLRDYLKHQSDPLPCYRPGGKLLVKRSDFDRWMSGYRSGQAAGTAVDRVVDDLLSDFV
jgi:hypothetical protein